MLSIAPMAVGMAGYYQREDYYARGEEQRGGYLGRGAEALGLRGEVEAVGLGRLFNGFHPDGRKLVQNAGKESRQAGLDLTFSADKSVSIVWALSDAKARTAIEAAQRRAVDTALEYLEGRCAWSRVGQRGANLQRASLVVAAFDHHTSRAGDPNLHTHALVLNVGVGEDGKTRTLRTSDFFHHKMSAGAVYRMQLAFELSRLGYQIESRDKGVFRIAGVPDRVRDDFSTRRKELLEEVGAERSDDARAMADATLRTRSAKQQADRDTLRQRWREQADALGWSTRHLRQDRPLGRDEAPGARRHAEKLVREAMRESHPGQDRGGIGEVKPAFYERDVIRHAAQRGVDGKTDAGRFLRAVNDRLREDDQVRRLGDDGPYTVFATRTTLQEESRLLDLARRLDSQRHDGLTPSARRRLERDTRLHQWGDETAAAMEHLTAPGGGLRLLNGRAGTGKTTLLNEVRKALEQSGYRVLGAAVSGRAARALEEGAGIESATIELRKRQFDGPKKAEHRLDNKTVLVVDEAGMASTRDLAALFDRAQKSGATVALVGDDRQLPAVSGGSPFGTLIERHGAAELNRNLRQRPQWLRKAVYHFANRDAERGLDALRKQGRVEVAVDRDDAIRKLTRQWLEKRDAAPHEKLLIASTQRDVDGLNASAQAARRASGDLSGRGLKHDGQTFYPDDRVALRRNDYKLGVRNGDLGVVESVSATRRALKVRLDNGQRVSIDLQRYPDLELGYAVTTHRAQGATVKTAYVLTDHRVANAEQAYVQASRATHDTRVVAVRADETKAADRQREEEMLADLSKSMRRSARQPLATEVERALRDQREGRDR